MKTVKFRPDLAIAKFFWPDIGIKGSAAHYIPELLPDVLLGTLDVSAIFTKTVPLADIAEGYKAMDDRTAIKVLVKM
jgi:threonine dehydrogenase-like Zn-dependent dehydrogenase